MRLPEARNWAQHGWRFAIVGILNTAVDIGLLTVMVLWLRPHAAWRLALLNSLSFSIAVTFSYLGNRYFAFRDRPRGKGPVGFVAVSICGLLLNDLVVVGVRGALLHTGLHGLLATDAAKLVATGASMAFNFVLYRQVVFVQRSS